MTEQLRLVDWEDPANADFLLVSQLSVTGAPRTCRLDVVGFANGLPLVLTLVGQKKKRDWPKPSSLSFPVPPRTAASRGSRATWQGEGSEAGLLFWFGFPLQKGQAKPPKAGGDS
jgi:hypothetical protein